MPPLTVDSDGWFTATSDTPPQPSPLSPVDKPQDDAPPAASIEWNRRPSTGPARKRDPSASRTPSGWIVGVDDVRREANASATSEKRVDDAPSDLALARSSVAQPRSPEAIRRTKPRRRSIAFASSVKSEEITSSSVDDTLKKSSRPRSASTTFEPRSRSNSKEDKSKTQASSYDIATIAEAQIEASAPATQKTDNQPEKPGGDDASTASSSSRTSSFASTSITSINSSDGTTPSEKATETTPSPKESSETASITSTGSTSKGSSAVPSTGSSSSNTPKKLRPRTRSSPQPVPTLGIDPKLLVGKVLTHIRRSPDHPTVTLSFADGTTYQILVDGYDPRNTSGSKLESNSASRSCVLEMDEALLRMLEVPGRHVVDRAIADCAHIRLADKAYERREWEQSWTQSHVAVAFKFEEESRWHCVWAMRAEYDERGCIFRAFDDVYLQVLDRQLHRSPQKSPQRSRRQVPPPPLKSPGRADASALKCPPRPPPSPTATRSKRSPSKTPKKAGLLTKNESWKKET